jgi:hypothetical protein
MLRKRVRVLAVIAVPVLLFYGLWWTQQQRLPFESSLGRLADNRQNAEKKGLRALSSQLRSRRLSRSVTIRWQRRVGKAYQTESAQFNRETSSFSQVWFVGKAKGQPVRWEKGILVDEPTVHSWAKAGQVDPGAFGAVSNNEPF